MHPETIKAIVSATSALIAVISAILAFRARVQTRRDIFEAQRDALALTMAENDGRCEYIGLRADLSREDLERIHPHLTSDADQKKSEDFLANLKALSRFSKIAEQREYSSEKLDQIKYSEDALALIRRMTRNEQVNSKLLAQDSYALIFGKVDTFVERFSE